MAPELADRFIAMYVNAWTLDVGTEGQAAVAELLSRAADAGLLPRVAVPDILGTAWGGRYAAPPAR
jgi:1,4-dihydroxy-6-naphthoate synthase